MANATTSGRPAPMLPGPPPPERDWPAQAADTIERVVGQVRDKTTGPALQAARGFVYGTFGAIIAIACLIVLIIGAVRLLDVYLPDSVFGEDHVWVVYLMIGLVLVIAGAVSWSRRRPAREEPQT
jgi:hypothetical protein